MKKWMIVTGLTFFSALLFGLEPDADLPDSKPEISIANDLGFWCNVNYQGWDYGMAWGLDPLVVDQLKTVPSARPLVETYQISNTAANLTFWGGTIGYLVGFGMVWGSEAYVKAGNVVVVASYASLVTSIVLTLVSNGALRGAVKNHSASPPTSP